MVKCSQTSLANAIFWSTFKYYFLGVQPTFYGDVYKEGECVKFDMYLGGEVN